VSKLKNRSPDTSLCTWIGGFFLKKYPQEVYDYGMRYCLAAAAVLACVTAWPDPRAITSGWAIPSEGYVDQPYVVVLPDGVWLCTMTTGPGEEGNERQHVVATRSTDQGRTWSALIAIEPHGPPESSWVMPLLVASGRVYAFYVYNGDNLREVKASTAYARKRVDTLGHYVFRYSDDGGVTWSAERYQVPIRTFEIDRENPYGGEIQFFWGVGKPLIHEGAVYIGLSKVGSFGETFIERSEGFFLRSENILTESDPTKIQFETLPEGEVGLRAPKGPIAEEHNLVGLSDGSLYCTYRTIDGHPCHAYSRDSGRTWTPPAYMRYSPEGPLVKHPRAANFVRQFSNGKYLYWFHNHGGRDYTGRNPAWLSGGIERDGHIYWSEPEVVLYADDPATRMSYPDFIEDKGQVFITETQKSVARVHAVAPALLEGLWNQHERRVIAREGLVVELFPEDLRDPVALDLSLRAGQGFSIEVGLAPSEFSFDQPLFETGDAAGYGWAMIWRGPDGFRFILDTRAGTWSCDSGPIADPEFKRQHVVVSFDPGPAIITFVVNGRLCDGGDARAQGWHRVPQAHLPMSGAQDIGIMPLIEGAIQKLRVYDRTLRTSEAVGNYRMEQLLATEGTIDDD
jgi:hypothetical protein